ncbi:xylulokinase [Flagellimonas allohymeniacidonis]|uniref:Carbohydrate kinase n=1 Tax=Flagellimonas allohymeniacidonis TaxID=2517819 RepID=A0A4Q8QJP7_9FLAO|nr:FGGY family carbohydrate kinase [Allomuricauda hymeniacidonis]TAI48456.1 carbohydrate kinase [Allomuricauda hymeniacidonis]
MASNYYLGIDIGSSSIKIALVENETGKCLAQIQEPQDEMSMVSIQKGWAEQDPKDWWNYACIGVKKIIKESGISANDIHGVGIAYQMHGLVVVDKEGRPLRKSIIWCDSRAVELGNRAFEELGPEYCETHLLNSPGNFTASKLRWVKENEPHLFEKIYKIMLPGDYMAYKLSGNICTTLSGLSEGIFWDFKRSEVSKELLAYYELDTDVIPKLVETFGEQGTVSEKGAAESGLSEGTPILYRAGDQPNNALALDVFNPGEIAATGGTSGVIYAVTDKLSTRETSRINNFAHVNHSLDNNRIGKLLCINGAGIQYRWLRNTLNVSSYTEMNDLAAEVSVGSEGVFLIPFGNGAERMLGNKIVGSSVSNLDLNRHTNAHICRAALEGIAFAFAYGMEILEKDGVKTSIIKTGNDNLFRSEIFAKTVSTLLDTEIEIYNTSGAVGAARACALKEGSYDGFSAFLKKDKGVTVCPDKNVSAYRNAYQNWKKELQTILNK